MAQVADSLHHVHVVDLNGTVHE